MGDTRGGSGGKVPSDGGDDAFVRAIVDVESISYARREVVRRAAAAERDATVVGELCVDDHSAAVVEGCAVLPIKCGDGGVIEWFGSDHQRVQRNQSSLGLAEGVGVPLGCLQDERGLQRAMRMSHRSVGESGNGALLPHMNTSFSQDAGETKHHQKRIHRRTVRAIDRAMRDRNTQMLGDARGGQPFHVIGAQSGVVLGG